MASRAFAPARAPQVPAPELAAQTHGQQRPSVPELERSADQLASSVSFRPGPVSSESGRAASTSTGAEVPSSVRQHLASKVHFDFASIRIHADRPAGQAALAQQARAFAQDQHIYFAPGAWRPESVSGLRLLTHELAHVVQQADPQLGAPRVLRAGPESASAEAALPGRLTVGREVGKVGDGTSRLRLGELLDAPTLIGGTPLDPGEVAAWAAMVVVARALNGAVLVDVTPAVERGVLAEQAITTASGQVLQVYALSLVSASGFEGPLPSLMPMSGGANPERRPVHLVDAPPYVVAYITAEGSFRDPHGGEGTFGEHTPQVSYNLYPEYTRGLIDRSRAGSLELDEGEMEELYLDHVEAVAHQALSRAAGALLMAREKLEADPAEFAQSVLDMKDIERVTYDASLRELDELEGLLWEKAGGLLGSPFNVVSHDGRSEMFFLWRDRLDQARASLEGQRQAFRAGLMPGQSPDQGLVGALLYHLDPELLASPVGDAANIEQIVQAARTVLEDKLARLLELDRDLTDGSQDPLDLDLIVAKVRQELGLAESYDFSRKPDAFNEVANDAEAMNWAKSTGVMMVIGMTLMAASIVAPEGMPVIAGMLLAADMGVAAATLKQSWDRYQIAQARFGADLTIPEDAARTQLILDSVLMGIQVAVTGLSLASRGSFLREIGYDLDDVERGLREAGVEVDSLPVARGESGGVGAPPVKTGARPGSTASVLSDGAGAPVSDLERVVIDALHDEGMVLARAGGGRSRPRGEIVPSDVPHVTQTDPVGCGTACGEMSSGYHARTSPGSTGATQDDLMADKAFVSMSQDPSNPGMNPWDLRDAMNRRAPVRGREWQVTDPVVSADRKIATPSEVKAGLEKALDEGGGVAMVNTLKTSEEGSQYGHWVLVRRVDGDSVLIHDPENLGPTLERIVANGFGDYYWTGDTVSALSSP